MGPQQSPTRGVGGAVEGHIPYRLTPFRLGRMLTAGGLVSGSAGTGEQDR